MSDGEELQVLRELGVAPVLHEAYVDLLKPTARLMGHNLNAVARLISHAMAPIEMAVWGLDEVRDWLRVALLTRLAKADPKTIQPPPAYIAGQVLLQLRFCALEEQLREMYANLLAAAMTDTTSSSVHPAFVQVIQQLTPSEAQILSYIVAQGMKFAIQDDDRPRRPSVYVQFRELCQEAEVVHSEASDVYLDNLVRLGLFERTSGSETEYFAPDAEYNEASVETVNYRVIELSEFGVRFLRTCVTAST